MRDKKAGAIRQCELACEDLIQAVRDLRDLLPHTGVSSSSSWISHRDTLNRIEQDAQRIQRDVVDGGGNGPVAKE